MDADTFFIRDRVFEFKGKTVLDFSDEFCDPYYKTYEQLMGIKHEHKVSFICHYMLLEKKKLSALKKHIEKHNNLAWDQAIISLIDEEQNSYFSEFETYANYVLTKYPQEFKIEYWFNTSLSKTTSDYAEMLQEYQAKRTKSLSFHTYNN